MSTRNPSLALLALSLLLAGCASPGGSGVLNGTNAPGARIVLTDVNVVDGSLRDIVAHNNGTSTIPAGAWAFHLTGTTNGRASSHDVTLQGPAVPPNQSVKLSFANDKQPDWQDGTGLTIQATSPSGVTGNVTVRTV